jgi:hypothetical protein
VLEVELAGLYALAADLDRVELIRPRSEAKNPLAVEQWILRLCFQQRRLVANAVRVRSHARKSFQPTRR